MQDIHSVSELGFGPTSKVLCIMPHPDDEAVFASGWLHSLVSAGVAVRVIVCTRGEKSSLRHGLTDTADLATERYREQVAAFRVLGVQTYEIWKYPDGGLESCQKELSQSIQTVMNQYQPSDLLVLEPDGVYGHPDHIVLTSIVQHLNRGRASVWYLTVAPWHQHSSARAMAKKSVIQPVLPDYRLWLSPFQILLKYRTLAAHRSQFQLLPWQANTFAHFWRNSLWWSEFLARG